MQENTEIKSLLRLIDDPDLIVSQTVTDRIVSFGKDIIPNLEDFWEQQTDPALQEKIELLIHRLHFTDLKKEFIVWADRTPDLMAGVMLVSKYAYPEMDVTATFKAIEKLRRNIWLELNSYLTPIEQLNVLNSIVYSYFKQQGTELSYESCEPFLLNRVLESRKGNAFGNGTLLLILCHLLDLPVHAISIPRQFILGYFNIRAQELNPGGHASERIKFYIDPVNGGMYTHKDVENYFKKISVPPVSSYFRPMPVKAVIVALLEELMKCYDNERDQYKLSELQELINIAEG